MERGRDCFLLPTASGEYEELINRHKASLDIFWLRDERLEESDNLPDLDVAGRKSSKIPKPLLKQFREIASVLKAFIYSSIEFVYL